MQTFAWLAELTGYRLHAVSEASQRAWATKIGAGVVDGLAVAPSAESAVTLSPGVALDKGGRVVGDDTSDTRRIHRHWP